MRKGSRAGQLHGMSIGTKRSAQTAWVQYAFDEKSDTITIQIYRYSWVVWEKNGPMSSFFQLRSQAVRWCKEWKFQFVRERVLQSMSDRYILKHQDGTAV